MDKKEYAHLQTDKMEKPFIIERSNQDKDNNIYVVDISKLDTKK